MPFFATICPIEKRIHVEKLVGRTEERSDDVPETNLDFRSGAALDPAYILCFSSLMPSQSSLYSAGIAAPLRARL